MADTLLKILQELAPEVLAQFKYYLTKQNKPIPLGNQGTTVTHLVQSMELAYTEELSLDVTLTILEKMDCTQVAQKLKQMMQNRHTTRVPGPSPDQKQNNMNFFNKYKADLEERMDVSGLLRELERCGILNAQEREMVAVKPTSDQRNHALIVHLDRKGEVAQNKFYEILKKTEPYLVTDLENA
ncbi:caspase recruitment domain-containing protein 8-like [Alosa sapidissima]|uniref:caspase recruitment domain-containing protein 8-like n=1 Tax=Alosa sapidissima TaxID=34773 RepID=UPI001C09B6FA|nr:caspase recruitment domain-containing protein 8-like [Alosa sapidissima]XP_041958891.1 caspase recruitment domain-containing protein 8-like [Alosa sapidissima]XP_041958892.1 caspase recruitment domain-containing protein 8-like [Alosa sapidissima]XP_041958893.1 caspase recruitment domain-containing protein 8-like [Alosa sapidissima]